MVPDRDALPVFCDAIHKAQHIWRLSQPRLSPDKWVKAPLYEIMS